MLPTRHFDRNEALLSVVEKSHTFALAKVNVSQIHQNEIIILNGVLENLHMGLYLTVLFF